MVGVGPFDKRLHGHEETPPHVREVVFDAWWHLGKYSPLHKAIHFQALQGAREHLLGYIPNFPAQLVEAQGALGKRLQHQKAPLITDAIKHVANRARLIERCVLAVILCHICLLVEEGGQLKVTRSREGDFLFSPGANRSMFMVKVYKLDLV